jgi:predicted acetyltransferase
MDVRLRPLRPDDETVALAAQAELAESGFVFLLGWDAAVDWTSYLDHRAAQQRGEGLGTMFVPSTFLLAESAGEVVGRVSIRHRLNELLLHEGGHIGLGVRPRFQRQGLGTQMLRQALVVARSYGIDRILITCNDDNFASVAMIERCGSVLESIVDPAEGTVPVRRYWID